MEPLTSTITPGVLGGNITPPKSTSTIASKYDPQAVSMVRALRLQESSNNYSAPAEKAGDSLGGAYQYQKPTWQAYAKEILGNANAPFTPENQDKVTYGKVKQWKDAGMTPGQIAHQWNPGDNKYPQQVVDKLKQIASTQPPTTSQPQEDQHSFLGGLAAGLLKTPARLATNIVNAGQALVNKDPTQPFSGKFLGEVKPISTLGESLGAGAELGSYLVGGEGAVGIGEKTLQGLIKEGAIQGAKTGAIAGGLGGVGNAATNDKSIGGIAGQGVLGAVGGSVLGAGLGGTTPAISTGLDKLGIKIPGIAAIKSEKAISDLTDRISPKPTITEVRLAQDQGRIIPGKKGGIFTSGTADQIIPTDKVAQAAETVNKYIPNHTDLTNPELSTALKSKVGDIATELKPQMEKVLIDPETVRKINTDLKNVQTKQIKLGDTPDSKAIIKKMQSDFQETIKGTKGKNMNDLWETAKAYDDSIPSNVKNAHVNSPESLQLKKQLWLQNRTIIKDAINDTSFGLGKTSKQAFSDMSDMYEAQKGLRSRAKLNTPEPSKVSKIVNSKGFKTAKTAVTLLGGGYALDKISKTTTGIGF